MKKIAIFVEGVSDLKFIQDKLLHLFYSKGLGIEKKLDRNDESVTLKDNNHEIVIFNLKGKDTLLQKNGVPMRLALTKLYEYQSLKYNIYLIADADKSFNNAKNNWEEFQKSHKIKFDFFLFQIIKKMVILNHYY